jgi:hypothetical protein
MMGTLYMFFGGFAGIVGFVLSTPVLEGLTQAHPGRIVFKDGVIMALTLIWNSILLILCAVPVEAVMVFFFILLLIALPVGVITAISAVFDS